MAMGCLTGSERKKGTSKKRKKGTSAPARSDLVDEKASMSGFCEASILGLWHIFFEARIQESCRHQFVHR